MLQLVATTFGAVFIAEVVGDKLLYTTGVLAARYRSATVVLGMRAVLETLGILVD